MYFTDSNTLCLTDSTINSRNGISILSPSKQYGRAPKCAAQSLPMAVPIFNQRNEKDYDEVRSNNLMFEQTILIRVITMFGLSPF